MRDLQVHRVYLGGAMEVAVRQAPRATSGPLSLKVSGIDVLYGKAQALEGASIHLREGEFVSVVGLNGAGKTTLFNAISGLVHQTGRIAWAGKPLAGQSAAALRATGSCNARKAGSCSAA